MKYMYSSLFPILLLLGLNDCTTQKEQTDTPNILWITIEDMTPMLGC